MMNREEIKNTTAFKIILDYLKNNDLFYTGDEDYINDKADDIAYMENLRDGGVIENEQEFERLAGLDNAFRSLRFIENYSSEIYDLGNKIGSKSKGNWRAKFTGKSAPYLYMFNYFETIEKLDWYINHLYDYYCEEPRGCKRVIERLNTIIVWDKSEYEQFKLHIKKALA